MSPPNSAPCLVGKQVQYFFKLYPNVYLDMEGVPFPWIQTSTSDAHARNQIPLTFNGVKLCFDVGRYEWANTPIQTLEQKVVFDTIALYNRIIADVHEFGQPTKCEWDQFVGQIMMCTQHNLKLPAFVQCLHSAHIDDVVTKSWRASLDASLDWKAGQNYWSMTLTAASSEEESSEGL